MTAGGGIRFGQYVLLKRIARGGMAEVFLAQQRGLEGFDRRVAVKRILPHLSDTADFVKMFLGEAKLAAQLTHPNVVHIYDFGKVDNDYFIAMEFVDGVHAGQVFKYGEDNPSDRMPPTLIARLGADAAAALNYAHELSSPAGKAYGLVHRDVSPANLMVSFDGAVKLCDFGIAKAASIHNQLTNPGQVKGKYAYMSPEQTVASPLDGRSDVFSLGILLWELLAGRTIVSRGDAVEAMRAIRDGKLDKLEKVAPKTPEALVKAVNWALETKRDRRATAAEMSTALEAFIKSSPELATPMQLAQWVRGRFQREMTGPQAMPATPSPGAGHHTAVATGTNLSLVTPASLIAASRDGGAFSEDDNSETAISRPPLAAFQRPTDRTGVPSFEDSSQRAAEESTVPRSPRAGDPADEATFKPGSAPIVADDDDDDLFHNETIMRSGHFKVPMSSAQVVIPTTTSRAVPPQAYDTTAGIHRPAPSKAKLIAVLAGLATLSFAIALAAKSCGGGPVAKSPADATVVKMTLAADAAPAPDAAPPPEVLDARAEPTIPVDALAQMAFLEVTTHPAGATVKIGDQSRTAPAKFAIPVGSYHIVAELEGWETEERDVMIEREHFVEEIAFTKRKRGVRETVKHATGKLTARTTPWSEVFLGNEKIGDTPLADIELPVGTYQVTFKNPEHAPVTKRVPIVAGKTTKVQFTFP